MDWYPWGEEALAAAKEQDKPIFLSVGYSTCDWCHVMEREVFEIPEIAALMNEHFINIKVDREQRPDIDEVYMTATQIMTQHGGWPMSVFMTPELKPFFAGTYFGPEDQPGRPGFPTLLDAMNDAWGNRRGEVEAVSERAITAVRGALLDRLERTGAVPLTLEIPDIAAARLGASFDERWGGFGVGRHMADAAALARGAVDERGDRAVPCLPVAGAHAERERAALHDRRPRRGAGPGHRPKSDAKSDAACVRTGAHSATNRVIAFFASLAQRRHVQRVALSCASVRTPRKVEPGNRTPVKPANLVPNRGCL